MVNAGGDVVLLYHILNCQGAECKILYIPFMVRQY